MFWLFLSLIWSNSFRLLVLGDTFPSCGDCWCIPGNNGSDPCPYEEKPATEFTNESIQVYLNQVALNPYRLNCNPYKDNSCETSPPQRLINSSMSVCGFVYPKLQDGTSCSTYFIQTFPSRTEAERAGSVLTHEGSCGLCSTTIDLALYLSK